MTVQVVTPGEMTNVKRQLKAREEGGWKHVEWSLVRKPPLKDLELVYGRLLALDPKVCLDNVLNLNPFLYRLAGRALSQTLCAAERRHDVRPADGAFPCQAPLRGVRRA